MYQRLLGEVSDLRQGNRRRIRKGLWALVGVTVGLLALVFISQSSKVIFLLLWIVSMFGVAAYLIGVEYMDYQMQHKVGLIANMREGELSEILTLPEEQPEIPSGRETAPRGGDALEGVETPPEPEESIPAVFDLPRSLVDLEPLEDPEPEQPEPESPVPEQPAPGPRHKRPPPTKAPVEAARHPMSRRVSRRKRPARAAPPSPRVPVAPPARRWLPRTRTIRLRTFSPSTAVTPPPRSRSPRSSPPRPRRSPRARPRLI